MMQTRLFSHLIISLMLLILSGCASSPSNAPSDSASRDRARAHTDLGAAYFQQNKLKIALDEFTLAAKIDPTFGFAYNGLGLVNAALGQYDAADVAFKKAISIEPSNPEAHNNYGNFLCSRGRYPESIKEYLKAVENPLYSTPAGAYTNAGICSARGKDFKHAEQYFNKALQIEPLSNVANYQLAKLLHNTGRTQAAYRTLSNVLLARPSADFLYLASLLATNLGLNQEGSEYRLQLFKQYPNSKQANKLKNEMLNQ